MEVSGGVGIGDKGKEFDFYRIGNFTSKGISPKKEFYHIGT
jgi:hypothetical protein